ncbi:hypothetical protein [Granulicella arctica]|uniref:Uncharacterized protein n=1 Tax=Granulicella arctica TaxID=940613 RepID=A0A7Y9PJN3_9BACT|nr:hypothetical protein [Granulicella arctica]NYF80376.1 hypothetical protein [Granulicella arctica]
MFARRPIPPPIQYLVAFLLVSAALVMMAVQHAAIGVFLPIRALLR